MAVQKNMLLREAESGRTVRVLDEFGPASTPGVSCTYVAVIDINDSTAQPELLERCELLKAIAEKKYSRVDESRAVINLENLREAERRRIRRRWEVARKLAPFGASLFIPESRANIVAQLEREGVGSRPFIYLVLRLGWQRGGGEQAYVTDYPNCGRKGQKRIPAEGAPKTGRPRTISPGVGVNRTEVHRRNVTRALASSTVGADGRGLRSAYDFMRLTYYPEFVELRPGARGELVTTDPDKVPTFEQFRFQWLSDLSFEVRKLNRLQKRRFEREFKKLVTGTLQEVRGPGTRYYIDATILDVYCVSRLNPNRIVGRPTLYVVVDQFSRMIVGMYVGLEPPCWQGAMLALWNCNLDKVAYCRQYGIEIPDWVWPVGHMPLHLMGDRGELASVEAGRLSQGFNLDVENAPPYCGEAKGVAERAFHVLQAKFGPYFPGYVDPEFSGRDAPKPALSSALNIHQITRAMISAVLWANTRVVRDYEGWPEIIADGTPFVPIELWRWGVENLKCDSRQFNQRYLEYYLWPRQTVKLTRKAVKFARGLYFMGVKLADSSWFLEAAHRKEELLSLYNPNDLSSIYLVPPAEREGVYDIGITRRSQRFAHSTYSELMALSHESRITNKKAEYDLEPMRLGFEKVLRDTISAAKKEAREQRDDSLSDRERLKEIKQNRALELADLADEALALPSSADSAKALPMPRIEEAPDRQALDDVEALIASRLAKDTERKE